MRNSYDEELLRELEELDAQFDENGNRIKPDTENADVTAEGENDSYEAEEENFERSASGHLLIPLSILKDFPNHKFKPYTGERLADMVQSIKENGIIEPLVVWKKDGDYIILSGHNRKKAAELAGLTEAPAVIYTDLDDNQAQIIVGETNLRQRSFTDMAHSERAFCLAEHYEALKKKEEEKVLMSFRKSTLISLQTKMKKLRKPA